MANGKFKLLEAFRTTFKGNLYRHRDSPLGNKIGRYLFEDLLDHQVSSRYSHHISSSLGVVNQGGRIHTPRQIRRNDSVFGRPPVGAELQKVDQFRVPGGPVAEPRVGCEVKILAKSQQKQIDKVINDLEGFALRMQRLNKKCINVAVVGINHESNYVGHEGERAFKHRLHDQEPMKVKQKLLERLVELYDEFLVLPFKATNQPPYPFNWLSSNQVELDYGAALARIGEEYERHFQ